MCVDYLPNLLRTITNCHVNVSLKSFFWQRYRFERLNWTELMALVWLPKSVVKRICLLLQETPVPFLGWEDPLEKEMVTHSSILAWEIPWTKEPGGLQSMRSRRVRNDWATEHTCDPFHLKKSFEVFWLT